MLKNLLIKQKLTKKSPPLQRCCPYAEVTGIGIIFEETEQDNDLRYLQDQLLTDGKKLSMMMRVVKPEKDRKYTHPFFYSGDIGLTGSIESESLRNFINQPLDMLLVLPRRPDLLTSFVVSRCKALKIGFFEDESAIKHLDLLVKPKNDASKLMDLLEYIRRVA